MNRNRVHGPLLQIFHLWPLRVYLEFSLTKMAVPIYWLTNGGYKSNQTNDYFVCGDEYGKDAS